MLIHFGRKVIVWALAASLSGVPVMVSAVQRAIGQVVSSSGASLGGVAIPDGGTIITGDLLSTAKGGSALVRFSASLQANLFEGTSVSFSGSPGHVWAQLSSGIVMTQKLGEDVLVVETPKYRIEPAEQGKVVYLVGVLPDKNTAVVARRGKVSVTEISSGRSSLLSEGHHTVMADSSAGVPGQEKEDTKQAPGRPAGQAPEPPTEEKSKSSNTALIAILAAGGAGGVIAAVVASSGGKGPVSPSQP